MPICYPINETPARQANMMNSQYKYKKRRFFQFQKYGSKTAIADCKGSFPFIQPSLEVTTGNGTWDHVSYQFHQLIPPIIWRYFSGAV